MGLNTRFETTAAATYAAPATTAVGVAITQTTNAITATTAMTVADGEGLTTSEAAQGLVNLDAQQAALVVDIAATNAKLAALAADVALIRTAMNAGE